MRTNSIERWSWRGVVGSARMRAYLDGNDIAVFSLEMGGEPAHVVAARWNRPVEDGGYYGWVYAVMEWEGEVENIAIQELSGDELRLGWSRLTAPARRALARFKARRKRKAEIDRLSPEAQAVADASSEQRMATPKAPPADD